MEEFSKKYYKLITEEYAGINLTRIVDYHDFYIKQVLDSVKPVETSDIFSKAIADTEIVVDVGFGGGFPLLPLAFKFSEKKFLGVETRGKKVKVVSEIASKLGLSNVQFLHSRIENVFIDKNAVLTFKAVGKVNDFLSKINTNKKVKVFFYKGPNFYSLEKDQIDEALKSWNIIEERNIALNETDGRILVGFENKSVPCGTKMTNQLVKVSMIS